MDDKNKKVDLQTLYPTALTQGQIYEKNLERRRRLPTPPSFARTKVALFLGFICFLLLLLMFNLEYLWSMGLSGISASFLIMTGVGIGGKFALSYASRVFEMFAKSTGPFLVLCILFIMILMVGHQFGWPKGMSTPFTALVSSGVFAVLSFIALCFMLRRQQ
ncbi:MAG TPA: hypothetical protein PKD28_00045 [Candidatus Saccharibacteria bacterium]|nr:hypothetical protein [Candidatus Saccharibacteria bacterium]